MADLELTEYILSFIDINGYRRFVTKDCSIVDLHQKPLFSSMANAEKAKRRVLNRMPKLIERDDVWLDRIAVEPDKFDSEWAKQVEDRQSNQKIILNGGLEILQTITKLVN